MRSTKLTPALQKKILQALAKGAYFSTACLIAGVPEQTGRDWLRRGEGKDDRIPKEPFIEFAKEVRRVEAEVEAAAVARIQKAAIGRKHQRVKIVESQVRMPDGTVTDAVEIKSEKVTETEIDWQADKWFLETRSPQRWGKHRMQELEALQVLAQSGWFPAEILELSANEIFSARTNIRESIAKLIKDRG